MPIFSFIGYTLTELFRKPDNWRQIYKQTRSTFYTSNDVSKTCWDEKKILGRHNKLRNGCLITFKKYRSSRLRCSIEKLFFWKLRNIHRMGVVAEMLQMEFLCDIKIYFYSIKMNLYSIKYIFMKSKYIFIQSK